jgi:hypothetical protein
VYQVIPELTLAKMAEEGNHLAQATASSDTALKGMAPNDTTPTKDGVGLNDAGTPKSDAPNKKKIKQVSLLTASPFSFGC